jgi:hypothetical protein
MVIIATSDAAISAERGGGKEEEEDPVEEEAWYAASWLSRQQRRSMECILRSLFDPVQNTLGHLNFSGSSNEKEIKIKRVGLLSDFVFTCVFQYGRISISTFKGPGRF